MAKTTFLVFSMRPLLGRDVAVSVIKVLSCQMSRENRATTGAFQAFPCQAFFAPASLTSPHVPQMHVSLIAHPASRSGFILRAKTFVHETHEIRERASSLWKPRKDSRRCDSDAVKI